MSLYDDNVLHQTMVEGYKEEESNDLILLAPALLSAFIADFGKVDNFRTLSARRMESTITRVLKGQEAVMNPAQKKLVGSLKDFAKYEYGFESSLLQKYDLDEPPMRQDPYSDATSAPISADGSMLPEFVTFWMVSHSDRIAKLLRQSWTNGVPDSDILSKVRGTKARRHRDGLLGEPFTRSVRYTVTTAAQHVSSSARMLAMRLSPSVRAYRWVSVLDSRTTPICRSLDGRVFEFGKGPRPPAHPGCRSTIMAVAKDETDEPKRLTYYEWLNRQSVEVRKEVLGPARYKLFTAEDMTPERFAELNLNRSFRPRTLDEIARIEPGLI